MEKTALKDLELRIGYPYVYVHQVSFTMASMEQTALKDLELMIGYPCVYVRQTFSIKRGVRLSRIPIYIYLFSVPSLSSPVLRCRSWWKQKLFLGGCKEAKVFRILNDKYETGFCMLIASLAKPEISRNEFFSLNTTLVSHEILENSVQKKRKYQP